MAISFACPVCRLPLVELVDKLSCTHCEVGYSQTLGIPDLRCPGTADSVADAAIVSQMAAIYRQSDYADLLQVRLSNTPNYEDLIGHEVGYHLDQTARGQRMIGMFQARLGQFDRVTGAGTALDVGCGSGSGLLALSQRYDQVVGVDASLPDLILALKTREILGLGNVVLLQANAQCLPFVDSVFDYVNALNVLEHVPDLAGMLGEARRMLRSGGAFAGDSRNRYDLFLPEPHVKVRWVGLMPRGWARGYVRWRKGVGYEGTYLHSYPELRRALRRAFGSRQRIVFPLAQAYGAPAQADRWLRRLERVPALASAALCVFPSHLALAWRDA